MKQRAACVALLALAFAPCFAQQSRYLMLTVYNPATGFDVVRVDEDGSNPKVLLATSANEQFNDVSPDGRTILFQSDVTGQLQVYAMNWDGSNVRQLTSVGVNQWARFSPDGTRIVYMNNQIGQPEDLFVANADGSNPINITNTPSLTEAQVDWNHRTNRLVFSRGVPGGFIDLYTMNPDGTGLFQVTYDFWDEWFSAWSADGAWIAYHGVQNGNWEVLAVTAAGANQRNLSNYPSGPDQSPSFNPENEVFFLRDGNVFRTDLLGSPAQQVTTLGNVSIVRFVHGPPLIHLVPFSWFVFRGFVISGDSIVSLASDDGQKLVLARGLTLNASEAPVQLLIDGQCPTNELIELSTKLNLSVSTANLRIETSFFDWTTNSWSPVDERAAPTVESDLTISAQNPSRFLNSETGKFRMRIAIRAGGPTPSSNWAVSVDQILWSALIGNSVAQQYVYGGIGNWAIKRVDLATNSVQEVLSDPGYEQFSIDGFSPTRRMIVHRRIGGIYKLYLSDYEATFLQELPVTGSDYQASYFSPEGARLIVLSDEGGGRAVKIYNFLTNQVQTVVDTSENPIGCDWLPNGDGFVYCNGITNEVKWVHADNTVEVCGVVPAVDFRVSPNGRAIAFTAGDGAGGYKVQNFDLLSGVRTVGEDYNLSRVAFSPDGTIFFDRWSIKRWNVRTGSVTIQSPFEYQISFRVRK